MVKRYKATQHINGVSPVTNVKRKKSLEPAKMYKISQMDAYKIMQQNFLNDSGEYYTMLDCIRRWRSEEEKGSESFNSFLDLLQALR